MSPQPVRKSIAEICLWLAILTMAVGGNVFQMAVIDPIWSASPPASVQAYFSDTRHMDALRRFHQNPFFFFGLFCLIGALILQWRVPTLRRWLLMAAVVELLVIPGTVLYVYPINDVLFVHAGGGLDSATADAFTRHWAASRPHTVRIEDSGFPVLAAHIESYRTSWTRPTDRCLNTKV